MRTLGIEVTFRNEIHSLPDEIHLPMADLGRAGMAGAKLAGRNGGKLRAAQFPTSPPAGMLNC